MSMTQVQARRPFYRRRKTCPSIDVEGGDAREGEEDS
jgi:hypothetical protein